MHPKPPSCAPKPNMSSIAYHWQVPLLLSFKSGETSEAPYTMAAPTPVDELAIANPAETCSVKRKRKEKKRKGKVERRATLFKGFQKQPDRRRISSPQSNLGSGSRDYSAACSMLDIRRTLNALHGLNKKKIKTIAQKCKSQASLTVILWRHAVKGHCM